jgi:gentisate 1,2-dioxygenase
LESLASRIGNVREKREETAGMRHVRKSDAVELLDRDMARKNLEGFWRLGFESYLPHPKTTVQPYLWKWADIYESLHRAGDVISLEESARRVVRLVNPGLKETRSTSHTLQLSFQYVKPGEIAPAHRHTAAAFRFVIKGKGAYTTVDGQQCIMEEGDLILTPQLTWHDHANASDEPILWLDGLDFPLVQMLHQLTFEPYVEKNQPIQRNSEQVASLYGHARPVTPPALRFCHYKWRDAGPALASTSQADPFDGYLLDFRDPLSGGPTLPTIHCALQLLGAGQETKEHRHTSTVIYHVFRGTGASFVGDERFEWEQGDSFVVPLWYLHRHLNRSSSADAILFSMSDAPVVKALGLYREES